MHCIRDQWNACRRITAAHSIRTLLFATTRDVLAEQLGPNIAHEEAHGVNASFVPMRAMSEAHERTYCSNRTRRMTWLFPLYTEYEDRQPPSCGRLILYSK